MEANEGCADKQVTSRATGAQCLGEPWDCRGEGEHHFRAPHRGRGSWGLHPLLPPLVKALPRATIPSTSGLLRGEQRSFQKPEKA